MVLAEAADDFCVKTKVTGLEPYTVYRYFFAYPRDGKVWGSTVGRTKAAPATGRDVPARFADFNCQDFVGRCYNTYLRFLLAHPHDVDFIVHPGDMVYETTGDPVMQQVLASFPILATWDDHEYSNDAWGDRATYLDERIDERNTARKRNAERAYFEYVPVDVGIDGSGRLVIDDGVLYPNTRLYRSFRFGTNVDLFLTDTRTRRPDHLIREDAFLSPPEALLRAQALVSGNQSITFVNALFAAVGLPAPFPPGSEATFDRGLSYLFLGKQRLYSSVGSRSIVVDDSYKLLSAILYRATAGATEDLFGAEQERWLRESLPASGARVKIVGSSISATSKVLDFTNSLIAPLLPPGFPDALRTRLQVTADDWDGFPDKRRELVDLLLTASSQDPAVTPSRIAFSDTGSSGFVVMTAAADGLTATYHLIDAVESRANYYEDPDALERLFSTRSFRVQDGVLTPLP